LYRESAKTEDPAVMAAGGRMWKYFISVNFFATGTLFV
jgi:hypothetical protein